MTEYSIERIREQFPILNQQVNNRPLVYLDNAASNQKPNAVVDCISNYYTSYHANIHRGAHHLAQLATEAYENARTIIANHLNAHREEIIFTYGTTDGINLVAQTWGRKNLKQGDRIVISGLEHHSNLVPWQMVAEENGCIIDIIPVLSDGTLDMAVYDQLLEKKPKLVAVNQVSNSLGTVNPIGEIISKAKNINACVLIDGAQAVSHFEVDVKQLDCDFYVFSGHKIYGPTGIGVLYGKKAILEAMPAWRGGGEMIKSVSYQSFSVNELPYKFEAGTPNIADGIALGRAIEFVNSLGLNAIRAHENLLTKTATQRLLEVPGMRLIGTAAEKTSVISFLIDGLHPYDVGTLLDQLGVAVRTGHHCTEPLMNALGIPGTIRASFACYNTLKEVDIFIEAVKKASQMLS
ncbi:MAG: SufS family cysteine desulfurase [Flavobacteriales bacterium]|nr:SufS family cysteine desulfurase [Flavobacteriales bacterium]